MKAILDRDIIVNVTERGDMEIGNIPQGVALERLRWSGSTVVDLADLSQIWVERVGNGVVLHCVEVPGAVLVDMTWGDRKRLVLNPAIHVETEAEALARTTAETITAIENELEMKTVNAERVVKLIVFMMGLIASALIYARTTNTTLRNQIGAAIDGILPELQALPLTRMTANADTLLTKLKQILDNYFARLDDM